MVDVEGASSLIVLLRKRTSSAGTALPSVVWRWILHRLSLTRSGLTKGAVYRAMQVGMGTVRVLIEFRVLVQSGSVLSRGVKCRQPQILLNITDFEVATACRKPF